MPKLGYVSASMAKAVMTAGRGKGIEYGETFLTQAKAIAAGMVGWDVSSDISNMHAVKWGIENEPLAVAEYELHTMSEVHSAQIWINHKTLNAGCTSDGLVGTDGMIEIKCPMPHNHLDNILNLAQLPTYMGQIQFSLWITDRKWCDFVSYHPEAPEGLQIKIERVNRDEDFIAELAKRTYFMLETASNFAEQLKKLM